MNEHKGWIGVDLDGTLAHYDGWKGNDHIGEPIAPMVERVKRWLAEGRTVKIFTARMSPQCLEVNKCGMVAVVVPIARWCRINIGQELPITATKDLDMVELWDDRCIQIIPNTGRRADGGV